MSSRSFLQGIFHTQGSNPGLLHCKQILYLREAQDSKCGLRFWLLLGEYLHNLLSTVLTRAIRELESKGASSMRKRRTGRPLLGFSPILSGLSPRCLESKVLNRICFRMKLWPKTHYLPKDIQWGLAFPTPRATQSHIGAPWTYITGPQSLPSRIPSQSLMWLEILTCLDKIYYWKPSGWVICSSFFKGKLSH